jgi:DNA-binding NtrC family response regulator
MVERTILIVEDDSLLALVLSKHLQKLGYSTHSFSRAEQFFSFLNANPSVFAVLLDVKIKGELTGIDVAKRIPAEIPIIFCTGNSELDTLIDAENNQIKGVLSKPVEMDQLAALLFSLQG